MIPLIFEKSLPGKRGFLYSKPDVDVSADLPKNLQRQVPSQLPEVTELETVRHFTKLSQSNYSVDTQFYPLGSCTMKYNPKVNESLAQLSGFTDLHPLTAQLPGGELLTQGALEILYELEQGLCELTGMSAFTLQPLAGAHGELTGVMLMAAYHKAKGNRKKYILVPDAAHGTNPATATIAGYQTITIPSAADGRMNMDVLKKHISPDVAGMMLTCPNTHGLFNSRIDEITEMIHGVDGIMYYDGANFNAIMGRCRPGDVGFDVMHINTHKTFTTPHGGGGPGAGPVGVSAKLEPYLPKSRVIRGEDGTCRLNYDYPDSIGYLSAFYGNFAVLLRAYIYIRIMGREGLKGVSDHAVLNANYIKEKLKDIYHLPFKDHCMHEVVFSAKHQAERGVHANDLAKYLIDQGIHPPTVYFPLTVKESLMIEPTETESKDTLDDFISHMRDADKLTHSDAGAFADFPRTTPVSRPDEFRAARELKTSYFPVP